METIYNIVELKILATPVLTTKRRLSPIHPAKNGMETAVEIPNN